MRVLHAAYLPTPAPGIQQQMLWEDDAVAELGIPWRTAVWTPFASAEAARLVPAECREVGEGSGLRSWLDRRRAFYAWLVEASKDVDVVLLRHSFFDPLREGAIRRMHAPVVSVHHTLEVPELRHLPGLRGWSRSRAEFVLGARSIGRCAAIVGVTREIADYEQSRVRRSLPTFVHPNGTRVDLSGPFGDTRDDRPTLFFAASEFSPWHGLDRVLDALPRTDRDFRLDLVGRIRDVDAGHPGLRDARVVQHGELRGPAYDDLRDRAWLGLASFAMERSLLTQGCTLKVRDYLKAGLPVYGGHEDVFPPDFDYYRNGPADLDVIVDQAGAWRDTDRAEVVAAAEPFIEKRRLVERLYGELSALSAR